MILNMWGTGKNDKQTGNDVATAIITSIRKRVKELEAYTHSKN
jgi:hypothetical protein